MLVSRRILISVSALLFGASFMFMANGLIISSSGVLLAKLGASHDEIGLVNACFFMGALFSTLISHELISRIGHIRSYAIFTSLFAISVISNNFSENLIFWAILRFMIGFCYYSLIMIVESWLNAKARNQNRSRVLAFYELIFSISFAIGSLILACDFSSRKIFLIGTITIILGLIPMNFLRIKSPPIPQKSKISIPNIFKVAPLAMVTSIVSGLLINGFFSMASVFAITQGFGSEHAGIFIAVAMLGGFFAQSFFAPISDNIGRKFAIITASIIALSAITLFMFKPNQNIQYILVFFMGPIFVLYSLALARANDVADSKKACMEINRSQLFSYLMGSFLSSPIIGYMMNEFGAMGFVYFYAIFLTFLIIFASFQRSVPVASTPLRNRGKIAIFGREFFKEKPSSDTQNLGQN